VQQHEPAHGGDDEAVHGRGQRHRTPQPRPDQGTDAEREQAEDDGEHDGSLWTGSALRNRVRAPLSGRARRGTTTT
jgi:hypothetical protein